MLLGDKLEDKSPNPIALQQSPTQSKLANKDLAFFLEKIIYSMYHLRWTK